MLACANRLLGDIYTVSTIEKALPYYIEAKDLFIKAGDIFAANEINKLINKNTK